jgi:hypothetical protein
MCKKRQCAACPACLVADKVTAKGAWPDDEMEEEE